MLGLVFICGVISIQQQGVKAFCSMNLGDVLSIVITGIVLFNLTNIISAKGKKTEIFVELIEKLQSNLQNEKMYNINSEDDIDFVRLRIRKISNNISCIQTMEMGKTDKQVEYIANKFKDYEDKFSNHITDLGYLQKSKIDFKNDMDLIDNKCDEIIVELYR